MNIAESQAISIGIHCAYSKAHEFLSVPGNFSRWASGLRRSLRRAGDAWPASTFGVLDHFVSPEPGNHP